VGRKSIGRTGGQLGRPEINCLSIRLPAQALVGRAGTNAIRLAREWLGRSGWAV
jgi:hypothetical protein